MSFKLHFLFLFVTIIFFSDSVDSSTKHPLKLSSSEIKYNSKKKSIQMVCRVFSDDFAPVINTTMFLRVNKSQLIEEDTKGIERYFQDKYRIRINDKKLTLNFIGYEVLAQENILTIKFEENDITLKKGDEIYVENELLFEEFDYQQTNWITINIPPFITNDTFKSTIDNFSYAYRF